MATHSSTIAWKIPWTEKPGKLQSMGSLYIYIFKWEGSQVDVPSCGCTGGLMGPRAGKDLELEVRMTNKGGR